MYTGLLFTSEPLFFNILLLASLGLAVTIFVMLFFITAGYGRHNKEGWGPRINTHLGWFIMEIPAALIMLLCFIFSDKRSPVHIAFLFIWFIHYGHRVFIYPFTIRNGKKMTITVILMGFIFNVINAYIQGRWLFTFSDQLYSSDLLFPLSTTDYSSNSWLYSPQFIIGTLLFCFGFFINKQSDHILRNLRKPGNDNSYSIPYGGFYNWITSPNYFGEIIEWIGWAVLTWSIAGLYFTIWTIANLLPRAISHHKWYKEQFEEYPENRKALIPFLL